ncbi:MAG: SCO family protein, partial [Deltaproteobacteria bacterium]|nr:SCO family protein [Deltaproteobacteria bacterium]
SDRAESSMHAMEGHGQPEGQPAGGVLEGFFGGDSAVGQSPTDPLPTTRLFAAGGDWTDSQGKTVRLAQWEGHPVLLGFVFTHCPDMCPTLVQNLKKALARLPPATRDNTRVILVSFDPQRDTPAALDAFAKKYGLASPVWTLLRAPEETLRPLAQAVGFYSEKAGKGFSHIQLVLAANSRGVFTRRFQRGLENSDWLAGKLDQALNASQPLRD